MGVLPGACSVNSFALKTMRTVLAIIHLLLFSGLYSQKEHTIIIPSGQSAGASASMDLSGIEDLVSEIGKYANLYASIQCLEKMNPIIEAALQKEMKKITAESPYILTVDYNTCQFYSLIPDKGTGGIFAPTSTVYYIKLYPKIDTKAPAVNNPANVGKKALLATYPDANGNWIAMGPYMTSDPYASEKQAIGSLFYGDGDLNFICERGKYRIYSLNEALKYDGLDVRQALKQMGIDNIPDK